MHAIIYYKYEYTEPNKRNRKWLIITFNSNKPLTFKNTITSKYNIQCCSGVIFFSLLEYFFSRRYCTYLKMDFVKPESNIQEFFKNKSVFVTGGTGFLGKLIVNKLIRSCPQIKHIYLLVRDKKGKSAQERLDDIFNMPVCIFMIIFYFLTYWVLSIIQFFLHFIDFLHYRYLKIWTCQCYRESVHSVAIVAK